jgi:hypothetical protein
MFGGEGRKDALLVPGTTGVRDVMELLIELDGGLGCAVLEASQAARIDVQHLSNQRHVTRGVAKRPPDAHPRCVSEQVVDQWSPLQAPLIATCAP